MTRQYPQFQVIDRNHLETVHNIPIGTFREVEVVGTGDCAYEFIVWNHDRIEAKSDVGYGAARYALRDGLNAALPAEDDTVSRALAQLETIVCATGEDSGCILLSDDAPTEYDARRKCQVYTHDNFSPLGDALVKLHRILTGQDGEP